MTLFTKVLIIVFCFTMLSCFGKSDEYVYGTGFFITTHGDLVTAGHVCGSKKEVTVLVGKEWRKGKVLKKDTYQDVCFVHVDNVTTHYLGFRVGLDREVNIAILSYPDVDIYGTDLKISKGTARSGYVSPTGRIGILYHAEAHPGDSGGPIVASDGGVIGELTDGIGIRSAMYGYGTDSDAIVKDAQELGLNIYVYPVGMPDTDLDLMKDAAIENDVVVIVVV